MKLKKLYATVGVAASVFALSHSAFAATQYSVKPGDSLYKIGKAYNVSVQSIQSTNQLSNNAIYPGESLTLPTSSNASSTVTYIVKSGDSLFKISKAHQVSVANLMALNNLSGTMIYPGQTLKLPAGASSTTASVSSINTITQAYTVKSGDSLYKIGQAYGVSVSSLKADNQLTSDVIYVGQTLQIPNGGTSTAAVPAISGATTASTTASKPASSAAQTTAFNFTSTQKNLLERLVTAEATGEPLAAQVAITNVILNRIESSQFPNTLDGVIYQTYGVHYAFTPVENGTINQPASASAIKAVDQALATHQPYQMGDPLFYYNAQKVSNSWIYSRTVTAVIGNTTFAS